MTTDLGMQSFFDYPFIMTRRHAQNKEVEGMNSTSFKLILLLSLSKSQVIAHAWLSFAFLGHYCPYHSWANPDSLAENNQP